MTTRGNSALRKKRFTSTRRVAAWSPATEPRKRDVHERLMPAGDQVGVQKADIGEVAVPLGEIEPVADDELVRDLEADVSHRDVDLAAAGLRQQGADLERRGLAGLQVAHQVRERQAGVDDVLDDEHVAAGDVDVQILENAHDA